REILLASLDEKMIGMKKVLLGFGFVVALSVSNLVHSQVVPYIVWQESFGGTTSDEDFSIQQTTDGGFILAGSAYSTNGDVTGNHGIEDAWIVKLDEEGSMVWERCYGGSLYDAVSSIQETKDKGFIVTGGSN